MKIDLHTHSIASPDGSLTEAYYKKMLSHGLDHIAITDHNTTHFAKRLRGVLGDRIIVGEEIDTLEGEIIGLYLGADIEPGMSVLETARTIKDQDGLVYIPHPFETVRRGLSLEALETITKYVDIVEIHNGRAVFQNKTKATQAWAARHRAACAASSDAHGWHGWGKTYTIVSGAPTRRNLVSLLESARYQVGSPGLRGALYPKMNRLWKKLGG